MQAVIVSSTIIDRVSFSLKQLYFHFYKCLMTQRNNIINFLDVFRIYLQLNNIF
jgi:hypothetical protein